MNGRLLVMLLTAMAGASALAVEPAPAERLDAVAAKGAKVMPFHLDKTLHIFDKTEKGGVQRVIAKDASDAEQVQLIRRHLSHIAARFKEGDFTGPASIHGKEMPGLAELSAGARRVRIAYGELPDGAQIEFSSDQPSLVDAIHRYFDAQLSDHARHAVGGHAHGHHPGHQAPASAPNSK